MPIFRSGPILVYYAHVPKCGGSAVETYLAKRFDRAAFFNVHHHALPEAQRWTKTSPQHVDTDALDMLFPGDFFDAAFTIVRHPVSRLVSAYHFQTEVERTIPAGRSFGDWLEDIPAILAQDRFAFDNHVRPMTELVPAGADVFHLEHGLDGLVAWCDELLGRSDGPRRVPHANRRSAHGRTTTARVVPTAAQTARIAEIYAADFDRFGYRPDEPMPAAPAPAPPAAATLGVARLRHWVAGTLGR